MFLKDPMQPEIPPQPNHRSLRARLLAEEPWVTAADANPSPNGDETPAAEDAAPKADAPSPPEAPKQDAETPDNGVTRAEEMVDKLALQVAVFTSILGRKMLWFGTRVVEEAQDLWAEAQNLRRNEKS